MRVINRYIINQKAYVAEKRKLPLVGFTNPSRIQATWDDIAVTFKNDENISINLLFNNGNQPNAKISSTFTEKDRLNTDTHHLLFAFAHDVLQESIGVDYKRDKVTSARRFLIALNKNVASASVDELQSTIDKMKFTLNLPAFFKWLTNNKMIPSSTHLNLKTEKSNLRAKSGDDAINAEITQIPDEKALLALGAIFHDTIPLYSDQENKENTDSWIALTHSNNNQVSSFVCTMTALAMSSPNRVAAEQVLLTKQRVQTHIEVVNEKVATVHYLNWRGSKGFKDNQNHVNAEMAESLDRSLHYTALVTEPARALARFYQNPQLSLIKVLGDFKPSTKNLDTLNPDYHKPTNLLHLGLLLGFYDNTERCARVVDNTQGSVNVSKKPEYSIFVKPIAELSPFDKLKIKRGCPYAALLIGARIGMDKQIDKYFNGQTELTIAELQNHYVTVNQQRVSGFNKAKSKHVAYEQALFTYTQKQLSTQQASHFQLVPIESLGEFFKKNIKKGGNNYKTIFERYGFSADFSVKPHQFRHWQNNYLANKGLPHLLITLLSGRKSPEQTLTYIHTTDAQNASVIGEILYEKGNEQEVQDKVRERIQSKTQYDEAINNLSPTFISEVGFCTQNLTLTPCTYMTEFETQCTLCSSSCHIAHDKKAIELLEKDLTIQKHNLKQVQETINFVTSDGMQKWYKTHYRNTCILKSLINVLSDKSIKKGSIVRVLARSNIMRITDLEKRTVFEQKLSLPSEETALLDAIVAACQPVGNSAKNNFLGFLGKI